ncbi:lysozyme inhibitor LprI family protein [Telluribacter sp. SYSU D00476]|uniref:lysozyme inhibitor LprI family protein n=1 Tax=Telluribacter sp. SYSU D00476 TaxID=2811430 RepID=UPI001FF3197F|nr:lysozyme inhibitor LprI family protein [Telluribacter sp. SYSU D00476]
MIRLLTLLTMLSCTALAATAQDEPQPHPIDVFVEGCLDKNMSTLGMMQCFEQGYTRWDAELNKQYKQLTTRLSADQKATLLAAQRQWIAYRDLEFKALASIYAGVEGTMYRPMHASDRMELVKKRALDLKAYNDLLDTK